MTMFHRAFFALVALLAAMAAVPAAASADVELLNRGFAPEPAVVGNPATLTVEVKVDQPPYIIEFGCCSFGSLDTPVGRQILTETDPATQAPTGIHEFAFDPGPTNALPSQRFVTVRVSDSSGQSKTESFAFQPSIDPPPTTPPPPPEPPEPVDPVQEPRCPKVVTFGLILARSSGSCWQEFKAGTKRVRRSGLSIPPKATFYETRGGFQLNGIPFPRPPFGAKYVLVEPAAGALGGQLGIDRAITINLGKVDLLRAPVRWNLPALGSNGKLAAFNVPSDTLGGLPVSGSVEILFRKRFGRFSTSFPMQVTLPSIFKPFPGASRGSITGATEISTTDGRGVSFDGGRIEVDNAAIGNIALRRFCFSYMSAGVSQRFAACDPPSINGAPAVSCSPPSSRQERFDAAALAQLPTPRRADIGGYFGIAGGRFAYGGAFLDNAAIPIASGITLERIGMGVCLQPRIVLKIDGGLAFGGGLVRGDASLEYREFSGGRFSVEVAGFLRVATIPVGDGRLRVFSNGTVDFTLNAKMRLAAGFLIINGGVDGFVQPTPFRFNVDGRIQVCIDLGFFGEPCMGRATVTVSNVGAGGCGKTFFGTFSGFFKWQQPRRGKRFDFGRGCKFQRKVRVRRSAFGSRSQQGGPPPFSFPFPDNPKQYVAHIEGSGPAPGSSPKVKITSPSGGVIQSSAGPAVTDNQSYVMLENPEGGETSIFLPSKSAPGDWKVEALPGSTVTGVTFQAEEKKPTLVTGKAKRRGTRWQLDLRYALRQGDSVTLQVVGDGYQQQIASKLRGRPCGGPKIQGHTGSETRCQRAFFTPKFGYAGKRTVQAIVSDADGVPIDTQTVTTYRARAPRTPGRVPGVRLVRRGTTVFAVWQRGGVGTETYGSYVKLSDGRRLGHTAPKRCLAWKITQVARSTSVTFELQAGRLDQKYGSRTRVTLRGGASYAGPKKLRRARIPKACKSI